MLFWEGRVATTFYHSTSGGRTVSIGEAWPRATAVPYLVSVAGSARQPLEASPLGAAPADARPRSGSSSGLGPVRDLVAVRGPSGRVTEVKLKLAGGNRTMLSQDFRRALDLRSTWFSVRVLQLEAASGRGLAKAGRPTVLRGFIRGLGKVRLERQVNGGTWQTVKRVRVRAERPLLRLGQPAADDQLPPRDARRRGRSSDGETR